MKKFIYILLFASATFVSISAMTKESPTSVAEVTSPVGGLALDPK